MRNAVEIEDIEQRRLLAGEDPTPAARLPAGSFVGGAGAMAADFKVGDRVRVIPPSSSRPTGPSARNACALRGEAC
jgi:hypothetical protein